jgi:hypothetical protein
LPSHRPGLLGWYEVATRGKRLLLFSLIYHK